MNPDTDRVGKLVQLLGQATEFDDWCKLLAGAFHDVRRNREVLAQLRDWAKLQVRGSDVAEGDVGAVVDGLIGSVVRAVLTHGDSPGTTPGLRTNVTENYPSPVACGFARVLADSEPATARYGAMLDTFETLLIFLTYALLSEYLQTDPGDDELNKLVVELLLLKPALSTGDWASLLKGCVRACGRHEPPSLLESLPGFLSRQPAPRMTNLDLITRFCHFRNRSWSHRLGRSEEFYRERLPEDLAVLEHVLGGLRFLADVVLLVPTRLEGGRVREGRVYRGACEPRLELLDLPLHDNGVLCGPMVLNRTTFLYRPADGGCLSLYPFFCHRDASRLQRCGVLFLVEMKWVTRKERISLQRALYSLHDLRGEAEEDEEARAAVEQVLLRLHARSGIEVNASALPPEDPDYSIPAVWADRADRLRIFAGRESQVSAAIELVHQLQESGGLVVVTGQPGIGKSSFLYALHERLADFRPLLHSIGLGRHPQTFLKSLIHQCSQVLGRPLGEAAYAGERIEELRVSLEHRMRDIVRESKIACVTLVDALDELHCPQENWEAALEWLPRTFLPGVVFLVSCRPERRLLDALRAVPQTRRRELELGPLSQQDVALFVRRLAGEERMGQLGDVLKLEEAFRRTAGHPLYLRNLIEEALAEIALAAREDRSPQPLDLATVPADMRSLMTRIWERATGKGAGLSAAEQKRRRRALMYLCIAAETGLSLVLLRALLEEALEQEIDLDEAADCIAVLSPYLREASPGRHLPFHLSLQEFVQSEVQTADDLRRRHMELARLLLRKGSLVDRLYWRRHLTTHVVQGDLEAPELQAICEDRALVRALLGDRQGAIHGTWLRWVLERHGTAQSYFESQAFERRFLQTWGRDGEEYAALEPDQSEELAELCVAAGRTGLSREAVRIYEDLHGRTGRARFLRRKAWVCYQELDDWDEALVALKACTTGFMEEGNELEAALARRQLAVVVFDMGRDEFNPEEILRNQCLPVLEQRGLEREAAEACEALGVVIDAEGRWNEAVQQFDCALTKYERLQDRIGQARVYLNRSIARLFTEGVDSFAADLRRAEMDLATGGLPASTGLQLHTYLLANRCLQALLQNDRQAFQRAEADFGGLHTNERWVSLTVRELAAVNAWFAGDLKRALAEMETLVEEFQKLDDAWGHLDNWINEGFLRRSQSEREHALLLFRQAYEGSCRQCYPHGRALAAVGMSLLGEEVSACTEDRAFYERHFGRLFHKCPSPFMPPYALLVP
jgi:hypothetical protein